MTALLHALAVAASLAAAQPAPSAYPAQPANQPSCDVQWPLWDRYVEVFVSGDGRVIDRTDGDRTTSEGQAYGLFFALVANDRARFDQLLRWTEVNLARGELGSNLPAWKWGKDARGRWQVLDDNAASDADLWIGYTLLEAARLWGERRYETLARAVLANVVAREVVELPALGPMLLPGPHGFALRDGRDGWRLNPSYVPPQLLRRLATAEIPGPWARIRENAVRMLLETSSRGAVADWVLYRPRGFAPDPVSGRTGSYDAIRTYLWVGTLAPDDPDRARLAAALDGMLRLFQEDGALPEKVDVASLRRQGRAPVGFYAALLPLAPPPARAALGSRVASAAHGGLYGEPPAYYDQNLALFALGFVEGRYQFTADGRLVPAWEARCGTPRP